LRAAILSSVYCMIGASHYRSLKQTSVSVAWGGVLTCTYYDVVVTHLPVALPPLIQCSYETWVISSKLGYSFLGQVSKPPPRLVLHKVQSSPPPPQFPVNYLFLKVIQ